MSVHYINLPRGHIKKTKLGFQYLRKNLYRVRKPEFGLWDALWWPHVDMWQRYVSILYSMYPVLKERNVSILDVGGGENIISWFITDPTISTHTLDIEGKSVRVGSGSTSAFVGDGRMLPFKSDSFDIVISVAALEHVPVYGRDDFLSELKRVAKTLVIVWAPVDDEPMYAARTTDLKFAAEHRRLYGYDEKNTAEHIASGGWVKMSLLKKHFSNGTFTPMHNCSAWLGHMLNSFRPDPFIMLNGLLYLIRFKKRDTGPPYFACKVVYYKRQLNVPASPL